MTITLGEHRVSIDNLVQVARTGEPVALAASARERVVAARAVVLRLAQSSQSIYGLNSALGANTGAVLAEGDMQAYQRRAVRARAVAVGPVFDTATVRAMQFARIAGMAQGGFPSGVPQEASGSPQPSTWNEVAPLNTGGAPTAAAS